ncbi:MAG: GNAT family N-acetyltransferase [Planctomycetes bacterium]|nr:GNAT family N-acetyltransferase [Planctomycetota bacterium]
MAATPNSITFEALRFDELSTQQLHEILRTRAEVFVLEQRCFYLDPDEHDAESLHVCGRLQGRLVAYARCFPHGGATKIGRVLTTQEVRGTGAGKTLMLTALNLIGRGPFVLEAQAYLERFYAGFGFITTGPVYSLDDMPHIPMRRE